MVTLQPNIVHKVTHEFWGRCILSSGANHKNKKEWITLNRGIWKSHDQIWVNYLQLPSRFLIACYCTKSYYISFCCTKSPILLRCRDMFRIYLFYWNWNFFTIQLIFATIYGSHCTFDTIYGFYCTISTNIYLYLQ